MAVVQPIAAIARDFPEVEVAYLDILDTWTYRRGARGENNEVDCFGVAMEIYKRAGFLIPDPMTMAGSIPEFLELFDEVTSPDNLYDMVNVIREESHVSIIVRRGVALTARHASGVYTQRVQALKRLPNVKFYRLKATALPPAQKTTSPLISVDWIASTLAATRRHSTAGGILVDWTPLQPTGANSPEVPTAGIILCDWSALDASGNLEEGSRTESLTVDLIALDPSGALAASAGTAGVLSVEYIALDATGGLEESADAIRAPLDVVALDAAGSAGQNSTAGSPITEVTPLTPTAALTILTGSAGIDLYELVALDATAETNATRLAFTDWTALDASGENAPSGSTAGIATFDTDADQEMHGSNRHTTAERPTMEMTALDATAANTSGATSGLAETEWNALDATGSL